jgi:hypothetical protein
MKTRLLGFFGLSLAVVSLAQAQTYNIDIVMSQKGVAPWDFIGSFTFNPQGTGYCSPPFCAAGVTADFSNITIANNAPVGLGTAFTAVMGSATSLSFVDFEGGPATADSSEVFLLSFDISKLTALGGSSKVIDISNVAYSTSPNGSSGLYACANGGVSGMLKCPTTSLTLAATKAPEINSPAAAGALTLLFGILAVARGRRRASSSCA